MELTPATAYGAIVRYAVVTIGAMVGVTSETLLVQLASGLVAVGTAIYGIVSTRAAEK